MKFLDLRYYHNKMYVHHHFFYCLIIYYSFYPGSCEISDNCRDIACKISSNSFCIYHIYLSSHSMKVFALCGVFCTVPRLLLRKADPWVLFALKNVFLLAHILSKISYLICYFSGKRILS